VCRIIGICKWNVSVLSFFLGMLADRHGEVDIATATGWTVRGSNLGGFEVFCIPQKATWGPRSFLYNV